MIVQGVGKQYIMASCRVGNMLNYVEYTTIERA